MKYAILLHPSSNRVYYSSLNDLSVRELEMAALSMTVKPEAVSNEEIAGVSFLTFTTAEALSKDDLLQINRLSCTMALFEAEGGLLRPVEPLWKPRYGEELLTIQKYTGKTNEVFTRMLLNCAAFAAQTAPRAEGERLRVLDPLAGRGTTLFAALNAGYDAFGIELGQKDAETADAFLLRYLRERHIKHESNEQTIGLNGKRLGKRCTVRIGIDKDEVRHNPQTYDMASGDALRCLATYPKGFFDMVAADLPYGIQHSSEVGGKKSHLTDELVKELLPKLHRVLRSGGSVAFSYNTNTMPRETLISYFEGAGFEIVGNDVSHRVDAGIIRDIVTGRRV